MASTLPAISGSSPLKPAGKLSITGGELVVATTPPSGTGIASLSPGRFERLSHDALRGQVRQLIERHREDSARCERAEAACRELQQRLHQLQQAGRQRQAQDLEMHVLRRGLQRFQQQKVTHEDLHRRIRELEREAEVARGVQRDLAECRRQKETTELELNRAREAHDDALDDWAAEQGQWRERERELGRVRDELSGWQARCSELESRLTGEQSLGRQLRAEKDALGPALEEAVEKARMLTVKVKAQTAAAKVAQRRIAEAESAYQRLQQLSAEAAVGQDAARQALDDKCVELKAARQEVSELEAIQRRERAEFASKLAAADDETQRWRQELLTARADVEARETTIAERDATVSDLLLEVSGRQAELKMAYAQIKELEGKLAAAEQARLSADEACADATRDRDEVRAHVKGHLNPAIEALKLDVTRLKVDVAQRSVDLDRLASTHARCGVAQADLAQELDARSAELAESRQQCAELTQTVEATKQSLADAEQRAADKQLELEQALGVCREEKEEANKQWKLAVQEGRRNFVAVKELTQRLDQAERRGQSKITTLEQSLDDERRRAADSFRRVEKDWTGRVAALELKTRELAAAHRQCPQQLAQQEQALRHAEQRVEAVVREQAQALTEANQARFRLGQAAEREQALHAEIDLQIAQLHRLEADLTAQRRRKCEMCGFAPERTNDDNEDDAEHEEGQNDDNDDDDDNDNKDGNDRDDEDVVADSDAAAEEEGDNATGTADADADADNNKDNGPDDADADGDNS